MRRLQIPLHLLRAFVVTARHLSMSRAAEELCLTQSAVSKQILELERTLDVPLFERVRQRLVLAPAGQHYLARVDPLLRSLDAATLEVVAHAARGGALHLSTLPSFGARWLIPRLPRFTQEHPHIGLTFVPFVQGYDFQLPELDCAIRYGEGTWPGAQSLYITGREVVLIVPPSLPDSHAVRTPDDVRRHVLLHHITVPLAWAEWGEAQGVHLPNAHAGPTFDQFNSLVYAVAAGMGIALVPRCLVDQELRSGSVSAPLAPDVLKPYESRSGYHLCYPEAKAGLPALREFKGWISREAGQGTPA